jgi:hypothetical protein
MVPMELSMVTSDRLINRALKAFDKASYQTGKHYDPLAWWPLNYINYFPLYVGRQTEDLYTDYQLLRQSKSVAEIAREFGYPSAVWLNLIPFLSGTKHLGVTKSERVKSLLEFLQMLEILMSGNIFCEDGQNLVWDNNQVKNFLRESSWVETGSVGNISRLFARLHGDLLSLDEAIFWNANNVTREVHGPYKITWGRTTGQLIVREYYDLDGLEFLPPGLTSPYKSVKTFTIYSARVRFDFPVLNDYTHDLSLVDNTKAVFGIAESDNGVELLNTEERLIKSCERIEKANSRITACVESLDRIEQVIEGVKRHYYHAKPIRDLLGKKWQVPEGLLINIRQQFSSFVPDTAAEKVTREQFYAQYDPRIDVQSP